MFMFLTVGNINIVDLYNRPLFPNSPPPSQCPVTSHTTVILLVYTVLKVCMYIVYLMYLQHGITFLVSMDCVSVVVCFSGHLWLR